MAEKTFSQNKIELLRCPGCESQCLISCDEGSLCEPGKHFPKIGNSLIRSYKTTEYGSGLLLGTACSSMREAINLAKKIAEQCDHYNKQR